MAWRDITEWMLLISFSLPGRRRTVPQLRVWSDMGRFGSLSRKIPSSIEKPASPRADDQHYRKVII